jgi:Fe-S-cluster containining protein
MEQNEKIRNDIDNYVGQQKNCCEIGCSFCCYQTIEVFNIEINDIKDFLLNKIDEETRNKIRLNIIEYFHFFDSNTPNNKILDYGDLIDNFQDISLTKKTKCPLLIDNKCRIYDGRPIACRIHIVEEDPNLCEKYPYRDSSKPAIYLRQHILQFVSSRKEKSYIVPLSYIIAEALLPKKKLKPITKLLLN